MSLRLLGILSGTITNDDRPQFMGDLFTLRLSGAETPEEAGNSPWLNAQTESRSTWTNVLSQREQRS